METKKTLQECHSLWLQTIKTKKYHGLEKNLNTQICIIGAGIAGLTTAYLLLKEGYEVTIIDKAKPFHGDTGKTSAHLSNALDDRFFEIIKVHGKQNARLAAQSHAAAIDEIERIIKAEKIACDFLRVDGYLFANKKDIKNEYAATQSLEMATSVAELPAAIQYSERESLKFAQQAQFHPGKYLAHLLEIIEDLGGKIYQGQAVSIDFKSNKITLTNDIEVTAEYIIQTSNFPVSSSLAINPKIESYRTYVIALAIPKQTLPFALYWDNEDPYHYIRLQPNDGAIPGLPDNADLLIVGGEDHRVGYNPKRDPYQALEEWVRNVIPEAGEVLMTWSGQILEPADYLAYIGLTLGAEKNNYMITGDSGNGLTHGTLGAMMLRDFITNKSNPWTKVYDPKRKHLSVVINELTNLAKSVKGYAGYVTPGEAKNVSEIPRDEGRVLRKGMKKIAAYRDEDGKLYEFSAVCPHLQAIIEWNNVEKTWDCPAHGSRFTPEGKLINGPATCDLSCLRKPKEK